MKQEVGVRYGLAFVLLLLGGCFDGGSGGEGGNSKALSINLTNPADASTISTPDFVVNIVGTVESKTDVLDVGWANDRGGRGLANGKHSFATGNIVLQLGDNNITITARDVEGAQQSRTLTVVREAPTTRNDTPRDGGSDPVLMYSYRSDLSDAAPVSGAAIDPRQIHVFLRPGSAWEAAGMERMTLRCCKGIGGAGDGEDYTQSESASGRPWRASVDLSGLARGGARRLRAVATLDDSDSATQNFDFVIAGSGANSPPRISGTPPSAAAVGVNYNFTPVATDADGDSLMFSIDNKPGWADFDATTGRLSGTPTSSNIGVYDRVSISVSDGRGSATLPAFSILVDAAAVGTAVLSWNAPTQLIDNSPTSDVAGYVVHYGQSAQSYDNQIAIDNAGITTYVVDNLTPGTWYFAVSAYDSGGQSSALSDRGQKTIR